MIKWAIFIAASLALHMVLFAIPFPVSFSEDPEPSRIVVDVELVRPAKGEPRDAAAKTPAVSRPKISPLRPEDKVPEQAPVEKVSSLPAHPAGGSEDIQNVPDGSPHVQPRLVTAADTVKRVRPIYPLASRRRGEAGEVRLLVTLGLNGSIKAVTVSASSGYIPLDESALNAVQKWLFSPGSPEKLIVPVIFKLEQ